MKGDEIITSFRIIRGKNKLLSSYTCFERAITGKEVPRKIVRRLFSELVHEKEYHQENYKLIIEHLMKIAKAPN